MMDERYKRPISHFKFDAPYIGFHRCCGVNPKVNFDPSLPDSKYSVGVIACPICNNQMGVIANGEGDELPERVGFLYQHWNNEFKNKDLFNIPDGFQTGKLNIEYLPPGYVVNYHRYFIIYKIENNTFFNYNFYTGKIDSFEFPKTRYTNTSITVSGGNISVYNNKWKNLMEKFFGCNLNKKEWSLYN